MSAIVELQRRIRATAGAASGEVLISDGEALQLADELSKFSVVYPPASVSELYLSIVKGGAKFMGCSVRMASTPLSNA